MATALTTSPICQCRILSWRLVWKYFQQNEDSHCSRWKTMWKDGFVMFDTERLNSNPFTLLWLPSRDCSTVLSAWLVRSVWKGPDIGTQPDIRIHAGFIISTSCWDYFIVLVKIATIEPRKEPTLRRHFLHIEESVHIMIWDVCFLSIHHWSVCDFPITIFLFISHHWNKLGSVVDRKATLTALIFLLQNT